MLKEDIQTVEMAKEHRGNSFQMCFLNILDDFSIFPTFFLFFFFLKSRDSSDVLKRTRQIKCSDQVLELNPF